MNICRVFIVLGLFIFFFACDGGTDKESKPAKETPSEAATSKMATFDFTWSAICRCSGETGGRKEKGEHGKICSKDGTYTGQHKTEEEAVEKMEEDARKQMNCLEGPLISFRYEEQQEMQIPARSPNAYGQNG